MTQNKIQFITTLFEENVIGHPTAIVTSEDTKKRFCLLVGKDNVSVILMDSFITTNTTSEIELFFKENNIYNQIQEVSGELYLDVGQNIVIWHQDTPCQDLNKRKS